MYLSHHLRVIKKYLLNQSHRRGLDYITELILRAFNLLSTYLCDDDVDGVVKGMLNLPSKKGNVLFCESLNRFNKFLCIFIKVQ